MAESKRLLAILNQTKIQAENPALYQVLTGILNSLDQPAAEITPNVTTIDVDTRTAPQTVNLNLIGTNKIIIKDKYGNAAVNNITVNATVDGVVNPTISINYGTLRVYSTKVGFLSW